MNELALFAGAGGGILGGKLLGWRTVCAVEFEPYAASVLAARQNDGLLPPFPIWDDVRTFDGRPWKGAVDVVSGGFPCQDISVAGGGAGIDGERSGLWREMVRIVGEVRSPFVFVENSPALTSRGLGVVLGDMAALGYDAEWGVLGASDVGAPHERKRIWILAYSPGIIGNQRRAESAGQQRPPGLANGGHDVADSESVCGRPGLCQDEQKRNRYQSGNESCHAPNSNIQHVHDSGLRAGEVSQQQEACIPGVLSDSDRERCEEQHIAPVTSEPRQYSRTPAQKRGGSWWATEPDVGRVAHGVAARVDRLKAIGNGQVSECAAEAFCRLIERITKSVGEVEM